ncbi:hypothetical protein HF325_001933 [Metschnikowia pulcherrima]|uniref:CUE domain-containing protein n=1 Tax=Metschnikowia pulcherrima TaxID=27326 RepID=A0A8H7LEB8_9ASCO|nr:hypothetical protein HF325_001933 [Metschnikowia pulcherrima]
MAKENLSVALSEPVALADSKDKSDSATLDEATPHGNTTATQVPVKIDSETQSKHDENDLEDVSVGDESPSQASDEVRGKSGDASMKKNGPAAKSGAELSVSEKDMKGNSGLGIADEAPNDDSEAPPRPTRPVSPLQQIKRDLKEAFPQIEDKYVEACLIASEGRIDPAFNALLYLLDPSFKPEPVVATFKPIVKEKPQFTDDELLARQLQKEFDKEERRRRSAAAKARQKNTATVREESDESPDEIDQLKEQFSQGFEEAKTTINGWVSGLTKKFSQEGESGSSSANSGLNTKLFGALGGSSFNLDAKNRTRNFDEDPEILSLDFSRNVDLKTSEAPRLPRRLEKSEQESRWQPLNSDVPVSSDAFLVTDLEEEERK